MSFLLFTYLALAIGVSFLCSILEAIILSVTPAYVAQQQQKGHAFGKRLAHLKADIDRPLAAILTLNTFAHTLGAAGIGAEAQRLWGEEWLTLISVIVTLLILVGSEIIPKTIGAVYWQRLVKPASSFINVLVLALYPFVWMSRGITRLVRRDTNAPVLSRNDIAGLAQAGLRDGIIRRSETKIIGNLMRLDTVNVADVMTDASRILSKTSGTPVSELHPSDPCWFVSRIPLYAPETPHKFDGYALKDEILSLQLQQRGDVPLAALKKSMPVLSDETSLAEAYDKLVAANEHIAWVQDAQGKACGLLTMEDIIETVLGVAITDEHDALVDRKLRAQETAQLRAVRLPRQSPH